MANERPTMMGTPPIPFAPKGKQPTPVEESWEHTRDLERDLAKQIPKARDATDIEKFALWADSLKYRDLRTASIEIAGDEAKGKELADMLSTWAGKTVETYLKETDGAK